MAVSIFRFGEGNGTPLQYSCLENPMGGGTWSAAVHGAAKSRTQLSDFTFTFHFHALEKEMATHSCVLAWRIPGMREPGGLPSMGSHRVGHDWSNLAAAAAFSVSRTENLMCLSYSSRAHLQGLLGVKVKVKSLTRVQLFGIPWTVAHQVPPSMGFSRQYWSGLPFPSPGESSRPRDWTQVSRIAGRRFNLWATREDLNRGSQ